MYINGEKETNKHNSRNINQGAKGSLQKNHLKLINMRGTLGPTCNKEHPGYTVKSGLLRPLSLAQYVLIKDKKVYLFTDSPQLNLILCVLSTDDNSLKPSIVFDSRLKTFVGLYILVDIVTEVVI